MTPTTVWPAPSGHPIRESQTASRANCATAPFGLMTTTHTCHRQSGVDSNSPVLVANLASPAWKSTTCPSTSTKTTNQLSPAGSHRNKTATRMEHNVAKDNNEYLVIGGGSGGAVVAARMREDPHVSVALLEGGPTDVNQDVVLQLNRWPELLESGLDWDYPIEPQENGNSFMRHSRARVLGGCSSHNSCIAFHPPAEDMDLWE